MEIKVNLNLFCLVLERFGSVHIVTDPDPGGPKGIQIHNTAIGRPLRKTHLIGGPCWSPAL
jgi:hypothetical protein